MKLNTFIFMMIAGATISCTVSADESKTITNGKVEYKRNSNSIFDNLFVRSFSCSYYNDKGKIEPGLNSIYKEANAEQATAKVVAINGEEIVTLLTNNGSISFIERTAYGGYSIVIIYDGINKNGKYVSIDNRAIRFPKSFSPGDKDNYEIIYSQLIGECTANF